MRLKRAIAIFLVCLVLALFLTSFHSLKSNIQPSYTQIYTNGRVIQKIDLGPQSTPGFSISVPSGKYIREINMSLTNIIAPNNIIGYTHDLFDNDYVISLLAMSFRLTNNAYLDHVSVQLRVPTAGTANFILYNAINIGGVPRPNNLIKNISSVTVSKADDYWLDVDFGHEFLNITNTYNNTFFIAIEKSAGSSLNGRWKYVIDSSPPGAGYAYVYDSVWSPLDYDFKIRLTISSSPVPPTDRPDPSDISLTINGAGPISSSYGSGFYNLMDVIPQGGSANFIVSSPWNNMYNATNPAITFNVEANYTLADISPTSNFLPLVLGLVGSSQGGGFLLFFGGGGGLAAALVLAGVVVVVRSRRRNYLFSGLRKLSRVMAVSASGVNVFDFPLSEDESEVDAALIAASISAVSSIEAEADTREARGAVRRDWFTTDKRVFFNLGSSDVVVDEAERSIFDGWWIGGVFDEPLTDSERNELRKVFRSLGDEAVRLARLDSTVFDNFVSWDGRTKVFKEFFLQVLNNGLRARGLSIEKVKELRSEGIQKLKMIYRLAEVGSSLLIEEMLSSLGNFDSAVVCVNVGREMWVRDVKNFLDRKEVKQLEKSAEDKEALLYSTIKGDNISRIHATVIYLMLLMKNLASRNQKLDVMFFGLPAKKSEETGRETVEEGEGKIMLENINPSDPKAWNLLTQTLFDIVDKGKASSAAKMDFANVLKEVKLYLKERKDEEKIGIVIFTAGGLNTPQVVEAISRQKMANIYTLLVGAPQEEKVQMPAQFIPIPAVSRESIEPFAKKESPADSGQNLS